MRYMAGDMLLGRLGRGWCSLGAGDGGAGARSCRGCGWGAVAALHSRWLAGEQGLRQRARLLCVQVRAADCRAVQVVAGKSGWATA